MSHRILISLCLLAVVASLLSGFGCSAADKPIEGSNLQATAGELIISGYSFTINPCLYTYEQNATEVIKTTVSNLSSTNAVFSMGDGKQLAVSANTSKEYKYRLQLKGETVRMCITKVVPQSTTGLAVQEALVLKIRPR